MERITKKFMNDEIKVIDELRFSLKSRIFMNICKMVLSAPNKTIYIPDNKTYWILHKDGQLYNVKKVFFDDNKNIIIFSCENNVNISEFDIQSCELIDVLKKLNKYRKFSE